MERAAMTVTGTDARQECIDAIDTAWEIGLGSIKHLAASPEGRIARQLAIAQASALLYIGDEIKALRLHFAAEHQYERSHGSVIPEDAGF
jgi:hypothetical protein